MHLQENNVYLTEAEQPAITAAFDTFFQAVQTKETDQGTALYSRPKPSGRLVLYNNPLTHPTHEQTKALQTLDAALAKDSSAAGLVRPAEGSITLQALPDLYSGFLNAIE